MNTGSIIRSVPIFPAAGIASIDNQYVWISADSDTVYLVDTVSGKTVHQIITSVSEISDIAVAGSLLYLFSDATDQISILDVETGSIVGILSDLSGLTNTARSIAYSNGLLFVTEDTDNNILQLDTDGNVVNTIVEIPGTAPKGIDFDGSSLWLTDTNSDTIYQISLD